MCLVDLPGVDFCMRRIPINRKNEGEHQLLDGVSWIASQSSSKLITVIAANPTSFGPL